MTIRVALNHLTHYTYDRLVTLGPQIVRLRPAPHCRTPIVSYSLKVRPENHFLNWQQDPQGNFLARLVFSERATAFRVEVDLIADMTVVNPFDFFLESYAEEFPFQYESWLARDLRPYLECEPTGPRFDALLASIDRTKQRTIDLLVSINQRLQQNIRYVIRLEPGIQATEETLTVASGSCRDSAWLLVQLLRRLGLAARFVSGYLIQLTADVKPLDGPAGPKRDFTDLHAWAEVYLPGAGWVGLDPTSGLLCSEGHIPLAATPDPTSAAPITGSTGLCRSDLHHHMKVTRIHEDPRVTKPYTDEQWQAIETLGHRVDEKLRAGDVRLTMGGEPTFVSIDDMEGAEWNTAALGPTKRRLSSQLLFRLRDRFAPHGLLHFGSGKWYPGESLPRWAFSLFWRRDGQPVWLNPALIAEEGRDYGHGPEDAHRFARRLAEKLAIGPQHAIPAWEDMWHYLYSERRLPINVDPRNAKLRDPEERARLARLFDRGLDEIVGYVLPLRKEWNADRTHRRWQSGPWPVRREHMFLLPGDSPMGLRLPIDTLPWTVPSEWTLTPPDPLADRPGLPLHPRRVRERQAAQARQLAVDATAGRETGTGANPARSIRPQSPATAETLFSVVARSAETEPAETEPAEIDWDELEAVREALADDDLHAADARVRDWVHPGHLSRRHPPGANGADHHSGSESASRNPQSAIAPVVRTALCVEPRDGRLHVFMPPTESLEDYLEIIAAVEETAQERKTPVVVEGYLPPRDWRLNEIKVTPDPGVIEVNVHPAHSWDELVHNTTALYEEARLTRLGAEKFNLDGRHTGTGGGNHVVLGGPRPSDSPFLRRPDLLRSLVCYWNNHPSLSYLFSSLFIGPTSQAPRIDEGRRDALYELDIACRQIPEGVRGQRSEIRGETAKGPGESSPVFPEPRPLTSDLASAPSLVPPWLVDRIFRNLLVDLTGNTHRAEFCIDKLYSPDSSSGRLGLVELRAFEMPPHARMSLTQQLLVRALVAWFWEKPYRQPLVPWGTTLHDRFMLPHFVADDFATILAELQRDGFPFDARWFAPHVEFRFPRVGEVTLNNVHLELRQAIEPWYVLGEEPGGGGTVRYVDSSVERVQIKVEGLTDTRHVVACNGRLVPLHPTGTQGEFVAAVRYRAWQPPSCLHPTIPVHTPLVFDLIDTWLGRSVGGCTYHVSHPGGRSYDTFPVNAVEAESRRASRFFRMGHTPGPMPTPAHEPNPDFPLTLDLRR